MINNISDLNLSKEDEMPVIESKIKEKLGIELLTMKETLSAFVKDNAEQLTKELINIIPYGDYGNLLEDHADMANFLKEESSKIENWELFYLVPSDLHPELIQFVFNNSSVDEGDNLQGHVFVNKSGKIKHVFAQFA